MYRPTQPVLFTWRDGEGDHQSVFRYFDSNGTYIRDERGRLFGREDGRLTIAYALFSTGQDIWGQIADEQLVLRIIKYFDTYYGHEITNCSAFAHYLMTGEFEQCSQKQLNVVLQHGMRCLRPDTPVKVGDMVCIVYIREDVGRSRKYGWRNDFRSTKQGRNGNGSFRNIARTRQVSFTAEEIESLCQHPAMKDFHFMICVDKRNGQPVWLSQRGYDSPGDDEGQVPFSITVGLEDPYPENVAMYAFIRRRR